MLISPHICGQINVCGVWDGVRWRFVGKEHKHSQRCLYYLSFHKTTFSLLNKTLENRAGTEWPINLEVCIFINASCFFVLFHFLLSTFHSLCCL